MQINRIRLRHEPGTMIQIWQTRDVSYNLGLGQQLTIENLGYEDVVNLHAATATALNIECKPRTYEEMLAGHTREGLALLEDSPVPAWRAEEDQVTLTREQRMYLADLVEVDQGENAPDLDFGYLTGLLRPTT